MILQLAERDGSSFISTWTVSTTSLLATSTWAIPSRPESLAFVSWRWTPAISEGSCGLPSEVTFCLSQLTSLPFPSALLRASLALHEYDESRLCLVKLLEIQEDELKQSSTNPELEVSSDASRRNSTEEIMKNISVTKQQLKKVELAKRKYKVRRPFSSWQLLII